MLTLAPGTMLGRYRLTQLLRNGEDRQVYAAVDSADESRRTVIKVAALANAADVARLQREYDVLFQACGPGVVAALEHARSPQHGVAYLVLPDQGPSLAEVLAAAPNHWLQIEMALAPRTRWPWPWQSLHARGWNHCDLKPGNVLCHGDGSVVLSDLEFATRLAASNDGNAKLPDSLVVGTPPFVAPELWRDGSAALSPAADVWALGVTLYLALFGEHPFGESEPAAIVAAIHRGPPPHIARTPKPMVDLLLDLLAVDPAARPAGGDQAVLAIEVAATELDIDLTVARAAFGRQAAALFDRSPPPEVATQLVPAAPPRACT